jgi:hypothetical protein
MKPRRAWIKRRLTVRVVSIATAFVLGAAPAMAFDTGKLGQRGTLTLDEMTALISKSAKLKSEVEQALADNKKKLDETSCSGMRFPGQWVHLGGLRVAPYTCDFGAKWLQIRATVRVTGRGGRAFETITPQAMKNATDVSETNPTWKWTTEEPPDD